MSTLRIPIMANLFRILTQNDQTVAHAAYAEIAGCAVRYAGFKDGGLPGGSFMRPVPGTARPD